MRNDDNSQEDKHEDDERMVLAQINQAYWLIKGERHLSAMLSGSAPYPTPVLRIEFDSAGDLNRFLGGDLNPASLWGVNPAIVDRLRRDDELVAVSSPDAE